MTRRVIIRPAAEQDITDAVDWYAGRAPEQIGRFLDELAAAVTRSAESPRLFRTVHREVRRAALRVFPYFVWFVLDDDADLVRVIAVTHYRRDPAVVRSRLEG
ncbi:MAG: type II toxin-antitoxin system RelE/ParE family toxin [Nitriliruptor sp.]